MMKHFLPRLVLVYITVSFAVQAAESQNDDHYWTHQYGAKGLLLNGAVIASTEDETAVFYNPGALGNGEDFGITLSFLSPTYSVLLTDGYLGQNTRANDSRLGLSSDLSAVGFRPFKKTPQLRAAITSFSRFKSGVTLREREVGVVMNEPSQLFVGNLEFQRTVSERWFGAGMAYRFSDNLSIGASQFLTFHSENTSLTIQKDIVERDNPYELALSWRSKFKYSLSAKASMLTKFGISANWGHVKLGATFTTATYHHSLKGASYDKSDMRVYGDSSVLRANFASATLRDYKTPWSIGLGADFRIKRTRVSISTEYFEEIPLYTVIDETDDPFGGLGTDVAPERTVVQLQNNSVFNVALGLQTRLRNEQSLIMGFRTDFNQRAIDQQLPTLSFLSTTPSVFHVSFGGLFKLRSNQLSMGLDYAFGRKITTGRLVDFTNITPENLFGFSETGGIQSKYRSVVFIFTYDFILKSWKDWRSRREEMKHGAKMED